MRKYKKVYRFILFLLIIFLIGCQNSDETITANKNNSFESEETVLPAEENVVETEEKAQDAEPHDRIISTTVAITEMMDILEIDLVGVPTSYKELPERYEGLTEIGNPMWPDMEILMSLQPTEVYSVTTLEADLAEDFEKLNVPATFLDFKSIASMLREMEKLAEKYDRFEQAEAFIDVFEQQLEELEASIPEHETAEVLILMGIPGSYIVGTEHSYIGDLVKRAGGKNVIQDREEEYISANTEYLKELEPDVILRAAHGAPEEVVKMFDKEFRENNIWKHFKAVQKDRVYDLEEELFGTTANLQAVDALSELISILYE